PTVAEGVEQPLVLVGVLPHPRHDEHRRCGRVDAPVVERVDPDAVVVDEHGRLAHGAHRYAPPHAGPPGTYSHISMPWPSGSSTKNMCTPNTSTGGPDTGTPRRTRCACAACASTTSIESTRRPRPAVD